MYYSHTRLGPKLCSFVLNHGFGASPTYAHLPSTVLLAWTSLGCDSFLSPFECSASPAYTSVYIIDKGLVGPFSLLAHIKRLTIQRHIYLCHCDSFAFASRAEFHEKRSFVTEFSKIWLPFTKLYSDLWFLC